MDGSRFDAWTRRRFGVATAGAVAAVIRLIERDSTTAKREHRHKIPSCKKLKQPCKRQHQCCDRVRRLTCDKVGSLPKRRCCYDYRTICSGVDGECCRNLTCGAVKGLDGRRCCAEAGGSCRGANDCCLGALCVGGVCVAVSPCLGPGETCPEECDQGGSCAACCSGDCDANRHCT
jgi:hypothetical protein